MKKVDNEEVKEVKVIAVIEEVKKVRVEYKVKQIHETFGDNFEV